MIVPLHCHFFVSTKELLRISFLCSIYCLLIILAQLYCCPGKSIQIIGKAAYLKAFYVQSIIRHAVWDLREEMRVWSCSRQRQTGKRGETGCVLSPPPWRGRGGRNRSTTNSHVPQHQLQNPFTPHLPICSFTLTSLCGVPETLATGVSPTPSQPLTHSAHLSLSAQSSEFGYLALPKLCYRNLLPSSTGSP